ncbi:hypothetical protein V8C42DRAFT_356052 [Trichoderma barbatum]
MTATLADIMKKLSITDALTLANNFPDSSELRNCLTHRVDLVSYFQQTFNYPITLMAAMFDCGAFLGRSRALEYFFPGSVRPGSDWVFYVPPYKESVADMVNALQICGVNWNTDASNIASDLFKSGEATISRIIMFEMKLDSKENIQFIPILQIPPGQDEEISHHDILGRSSSILHGILIICSNTAGFKSCLSFIGDLYASNIQCFIGGWCATTIWRFSSEKNDALILKAKRNDKTRGFRYKDGKGSGCVIRAFTDDEAHLEWYGNMYHNWLDLRQDNIESIKWIEHDGYILGVYSSQERFHRDPNIIPFANDRLELPWSARRRLGDMITASTKCPDELRSTAYHSAVGNNVMEDGWEMQTVARSGTASFLFKDATPWSWVL